MGGSPKQLGYAGLRMTADEYLAIGETRERYELIDGLVVESGAASPLHQQVLGEVMFQLANFTDESREIAVFPSTDVRLSDRLNDE